MKARLLGLAAGALIAGTAHSAEITFAHGANPGNPRSEAADMFATLVESCTAGEMTVQVAGSATMGDDAEMLTSAQAGVINMTANSQGAMSQFVPEIALLGLPFLFSDLTTAWQVLDGEVGDLIAKRAEESGLKLVGYWDNGIRHVSHLNKFVATPEAVTGMKIRTPPDQMTINIFEALGANPAPLAFSELPTALQAGTFDGQENPLINIYTSGIHEITPYITLTAHKYEATPVVAGLSWWSSLDDATRSCIQQATDRAGWYQRGLMLQADETLPTTMKAEGAQFAEVEDRQAFIDATASVYEQYAAEYPELVSKLREAAGQ